MRTSRRRGRAAGVVGTALLLAALLGGCRAVNVASGYTLDPGKDTGVAVVSLTRAGLPSRFNMLLKLRGVDGDYRNSVPVSDAFASADWRCPFFGTATEEEPCGRLAVIELRQGLYEFYSWEGDTGTGGSVRSIGEFSKRFRVEAGKAVYLGNVHFSVETPRWFQGTYRMRVIDMRERDLALLRQKVPTITPDRVVVSILPQ